MADAGRTNETVKGNCETYASQASGNICGFSLYAMRIN